MRFSVTAIAHDNVRPRYDNFVSSYDNVVSAVAVSQDNEWIASGSTDTTIILWFLKQRRIVHEWVAHRGEVTCLAFSPDGQSLVSGGRDSAIVIWDISRPQGAQRILTLGDRHGSPPEACAWSRAHCEHGSLVACAFPKERKIHVWDAHTLQHRYTLAFHGFACAKDFFTFSPDGRWLAAEGVRGSCFVWETATGALHTVLRDPGLDIRTTVFDPSSKRIATTSGRGGNAMVQIWGVEAGVRVLSFGKGPLGAMGSLNVSFSPDGRTVLSVAGDRLTIWDAATGGAIRALHGSVDLVIRLCFSPDGKYVASTSFDGAVKLWRVRDGACVATLSACPRVTLYVGFSAMAETVFYACDDGTVYMHRLHDVVERSTTY
ncbi:HET-E [Ganoderma leucocontextum]|nr:HET-E [Ganoderma leucocontextum]